MGQLTADECDFLKDKGIAPSDVFDATDIPTSVWQAQMKELGFGFAFGKFCKRGHHRLRTRKNHCIQCNPQSISHYKRFRQPGFVYIARSLKTNRIKVGSTKELEERKKNLNFDRYGGANDWTILATAWTNSAGEIECKAHKLLRVHSIEASYLKAGETTNCNEVFSCTFSAATKALTSVLPTGIQLKIS